MNLETLQRENAQLKHLLSVCNKYEGLLTIIKEKDVLQQQVNKLKKQVEEVEKTNKELTRLLEVQNEEAVEILTEKAIMFNKVLILEKRVGELKKKVCRYKKAISKLR